MPYIVKQKLKIEDLVSLPKQPARVLVFEPSAYLGALYRHYFGLHGFEAMHSPDLDGLPQVLSVFLPGLLVFSAEQPRPEAALRPLLRDFPGLKIVTTAYNLNHAVVSRLMSAGVLSHINRRFSRPQDLVVLARTLINH